MSRGGGTSVCEHLHCVTEISSFNFKIYIRYAHGEFIGVSHTFLWLCTGDGHGEAMKLSILEIKTYYS